VQHRLKFRQLSLNECCWVTARMLTWQLIVTCDLCALTSDHRWLRTCNSSVPATGWTTEISWSDCWHGQGNVLSPHGPTSCGFNPPSYSMETRGTFPASKAAGACNWPLTHISPDIKNEWSCTSPPPLCLHGLYRDSFTFKSTFLSRSHVSSSHCSFFK